MAKRLGCVVLSDEAGVEAIPDEIGAVICVKPRFDRAMLATLARRCKVVWDIIDRPPPAGVGIAHFIASTRYARDMFREAGEIAVIPHHHCNTEGGLATGSAEEVSWIGAEYWAPLLEDVRCAKHDVAGLTPEAVAALYRASGLMLNLRRRRQGHAFHAAVNSGVKLINCFGFALPSVSEREPPYLELDRNCTLFCEEGDVARCVRLLQADKVRYEEMREACRCRAGAFSIESVAEQYGELIASL